MWTGDTTQRVRPFRVWCNKHHQHHITPERIEGVRLCLIGEIEARK